MPAAPNVLALVPIIASAAGSAVVPLSRLYARHTFHVYLTAGGSVAVQTCATGVDGDYLDHSTALAASGIIDHAGRRLYLRVAWSGVGGTIRVDAEQYGDDRGEI